MDNPFAETKKLSNVLQFLSYLHQSGGLVRPVFPTALKTTPTINSEIYENRVSMGLMLFKSP